MKLEAAVARLRSLPDPLPPVAREIDTRVSGSVGRRPAWVRSPTDATPLRRAAGLVLLIPDDDGVAHVVLIERPAGDLRHAGQVSLPGGAEDPGDEFPVGTALREAAEEVGLDVAHAGLEVLGCLDVVDVRVSGFLLTPVIGVATRAPSLVAHPREVAAILRAPLTAFLPDAPVEVREEERDGFLLRYGGYPVGGYHIWGATARVLGQLGAILGREEDAGPVG